MNMSHLSQSDSDLCKTPDSKGDVRKRKQPECEFTQALNALSLEFKNTLNEWRKELDTRITTISDNVSNIRGEIAAFTQVTTEIKNDIATIRSDQSQITTRLSELDKKYDQLAIDLIAVQNSVEYVSAEQIDLNNRLKMQEMDTKKSISDLISKIDYLDQNARQCNLEICNVPERRNENLITIMESIGSKINYSVCAKDVVAIHRVPHAHQQNDKPKNIVVKLASRILRDNVLSAFRLAKGLTSDQLSISGTPSRIYMHEHLTLKRKLLFRDTKEAAQRNNYKFVWVKHGTILVREKEQSKSFAIRSHQDIGQIKPGAAAKDD